MQEDGTIVKRIPLKQILIPAEPVRKNVKSSRIKMFEENYKEGAPIQPIKVIPIQNGDPKNINYLLIGGLHRYNALNSLDYKETDALVNLTTVLTPHDLDTNAAKITIDTAQLEDNARGSLQHTDEEIKDFARKNFARGATTAFLAEKTGYALRTIERWVADLADEQKKEKRQKALRMFSAGKSIEDIAEKVGVGRSTAHRWITETNGHPTKANTDKNRGIKQKNTPQQVSHTTDFENPKNDTCRKWDKKNDSDMPQDKPQATTSEGNIQKNATTEIALPQVPTQEKEYTDDPDTYYANQMDSYSARMNDYQRLQAAAIFLKSLTPSADMESQMLKYILPLIANHFPNLQQANIKNIDYAFRAEQLTDTLNTQKNRAMALNRLLTEAKNKISSLEEDLNKRKNACSMTCPFTMDRMEHEEEKNIKNTVDEIKELSLVLSGNVTKMPIKQVTPLQKKLHGYINSEHQAPVKDITKQLILNRAFSLCSQLEACTHHAMLTDKVAKYLEDAKKRLGGIGIKPLKGSRNGKKTPTPSRALSDGDAYKNLYHRFDEITKKREYIEERKTVKKAEAKIK